MVTSCPGSMAFQVPTSLQDDKTCLKAVLFDDQGSGRRLHDNGIRDTGVVHEAEQVVTCQLTGHTVNSTPCRCLASGTFSCHSRSPTRGAAPLRPASIAAMAFMATSSGAPIAKYYIALCALCAMNMFGCVPHMPHLLTSLQLDPHLKAAEAQPCVNSVHRAL